MNFDFYTRPAEHHLSSGDPSQDSFSIRESDDGCIFSISDGCSSMRYSHNTSFSVSRMAVSCETMDVLNTSDICKLRNEYEGHATLIWGKMSANKLDLVIKGDGAWGYKTVNGDCFYFEIDWYDTPPYPTYRGDILNQWNIEPRVKSNMPVAYTLLNTVFQWTSMDISNIAQLWFSSDGILKVADISDISIEMTALKNTNGSFLKRRLSRWLRDKSFLDDVTVLSFYKDNQNDQDSLG